MNPRLSRVRVAGFRSLQDVTLEPGPVTVLIGPNGSGKSNLLHALRMVRELASGSLQLFVGRNGGASALLHYGQRKTPVLELALEFGGGAQGDRAYACQLGYAPGDTLHFLEERVGERPSAQAEWVWSALRHGQRESRLGDDAPGREVRSLLQGLSLFHFHDTSMTSPLRANARAGDDRSLRPDGSNLAAFLLARREQPAFGMIEWLVRRIAPCVQELVPTAIEGNAVRLDWLDDRKERFGAAFLSDGTLRALALVTALGQPADDLPLLSVIDEPELGLHPTALHLLCELAQSASVHGQVLFATQSPAVLDSFGAEDVVVAERVDAATSLRRLDTASLAAWLEDYTLSELYDSNFLGGRP
jgi:predicted ATPase